MTRRGRCGCAILRWRSSSRNACIVNANFSDYHVPVQADVPEIDVILVDEEDKHVNPLGAKGIAELALVGVAPALGMRCTTRRASGTRLARHAREQL